MRFSEKLPKLRKDNNLSQEQLADKLGVSRQAVSKWESGNSYPDMEKMLQMCKILNCHLEDIMDDGSIGQNKQDKKGKIDFYAYMKDFLNFITKSYNMFCSMKFKEKIKCLFEMAIIALILFIVSNIVYSVLEYIIYGLIPIAVFWKIVSILLKTILMVISVIIFIHLFKIRYLDYFVTVEDQNVTEKTIEEPIEKKENKYYKEMPKEKIIIRDPKHATFKFFDALGKALSVMVKIFIIFVAIPVVIMFAIAVGLIFASLFHLSYGVIFLFIAIAFLGATLLLYDVIELLYNAVVEREQHFKRMFIIAIIGLVMCGAGVGLAICSYLSYEVVNDFSDEQYITQTENIEMQDNLYISKNYKCEYVIDNSVSNIQIEIRHIPGTSVETDVTKGKTYSYCDFYSNTNAISAYKIFMKDLKEKKIRNYDKMDTMKIKITTSQENYDKLEANYKKFTN